MNSNGCPQTLADYTAECRDSHHELRRIWSELMTRVEAEGWVRGADNALRCPECSAAATTPATIAGISYEKWIEAVELVVAGKPPSTWSGTNGLPTSKQFNNVIHSGRYPELRAKWQAAPTFKGPRKEYADALPEDRWAFVLERFDAGESKAAICTGEAGVWPTHKQWDGRMARDVAFRTAILGEWEWRAMTRQEMAEERAARRREKARIRAANREGRNLGRSWKEPIGFHLNKSLRQNEIYAAVSKAVRIQQPRHMRDDIISAMVLDILEGKLDPLNLSGKVPTYIAEWRRGGADDRRNVSLERPAMRGRAGDTIATLGEQLTDDDSLGAHF